uniref:Uncharacterized protein n=1 Tax=Anguilla anguilla TaxID=7936 RepID=A0A0E9QC35_ANGAN
MLLVVGSSDYAKILEPVSRG